jgi:hypothetical protein
VSSIERIKSCAALATAASSLGTPRAAAERVA